jgi:small-conductance mechanosensitive channel
MALGMLWYSPVLFGNIWLKLVDKKVEDISQNDANKSMGLAIIPAIVSSFGLALLISLIGAVTVLDAIIAGSLASIAFSGMSALNLVFFEDRSFKLTLLHFGYNFVSFLICAVVLTLWK